MFLKPLFCPPTCASCGNFMIAAAIESCAEALTLAEKNGLDRTEVVAVVVLVLVVLVMMVLVVLVVLVLAACFSTNAAALRSCPC